MEKKVRSIKISWKMEKITKDMDLRPMIGQLRRMEARLKGHPFGHKRS